jgi:hypothetical protein
MKKLLGLLSAASLIATTGASVVSCGFISRIADPSDTTGDDEDGQVELLLALRNSDLGKLTSDQYNSKSYILNKIAELNPDFKIEEIEITDMSSVTTTVVAKEGSKYYKGTAYVSYNIDDSLYTELSEVITDPNLGNIYKKNSECILNALKAKYPDLDTSILLIQPSFDSSNTAYIKVMAWPNDKFLIGEVTVNFELPKDIDSIIDYDTTVFGRIADNKEATIRATLQDKEKSLRMDEIEITDISDESATIKAIDGSVYYKGLKKVYFVTKQTDLSEVLPDEKRDLGKISFDDDNWEKKLLLKVQDCDATEHFYMDQVKITNKTDTEFTVTANDDSDIYSGEVTFTYIRDTRRNVFEDIDSNRVLKIPDNEDETIWNELEKQNPNLQISELEFVEGSKTIGGVQVAVKEGSEIYFAPAVVTIVFTIVTE